MLNADNGTYDSWYWAHPPMYMPQNCNLDDVAHIKQFVDIPVVCAGRMEPDVAAEAIAAGKIDGMGVARQFLADPQWITKLIEDRIEDIKPCICCHSGCFNFSSSKGHYNTQDLTDTMGLARCAINAETMQSKKHYIKPARKSKNIAVIGGGLTGCEIAYELYLQGKKPTIVEMQDDLITTPGICLANTSFLRDFFKANEVTVHLETGVCEIMDDGVEVRDKNGAKFKIAADNVILSTGYKSAPLAPKGKHIHLVGDCSKVGNLRTVIWQAWDVAMKL